MNALTEKKRKQCGGASLLVVMTVLTAFTLLVVGLLQLGRLNAEEVVMQEDITQAHWLAEAGLECAVSLMLGAPVSYADSVSGDPNAPDQGPAETMTDSNGKEIGDFSSEYWRDTLAGNRSRLTLTGIGTAGDAVREIRSEIEYAPGVMNAITGLSGSSTINQNVVVKGTVYQVGDLEIKSNTSVTDIVTAEGGVVHGNGSYTEGELPDPRINKIDRTPYETLIATAATYPPASQTNNTPINLNGSTLYVNGNLTVDTVQIDGPGTIVAAGDISFKKNQGSISAGIKIVAAGDVNFDQKITLADNTLVYAGNDIVSRQQGTVALGTSFLAIGSIYLEQRIEFQGILYAEGDIVSVAQGSDISGTIVAWNGFEIGQNTTVTYDPTVFAEDIAAEINGTFEDLIVLGQTWDDITGD